MLNGLAPLTHCLRIGIEAPLHGFEHALVFMARDASFSLAGQR